MKFLRALRAAGQAFKASRDRRASTAELSPNTDGRCVDCGFLSMRAKRIDGHGRPHAGYHEVDQEDRDKPLATFDFVPGETNAVQKAELVCFRGAANLPREISDTASSRKIAGDEATSAVLRKDRSCKRWGRYVPGLGPRQQFMELEAAAHEQDRRDFHVKLSEWERQQSDRERRQDRRLAKAAIIFAVIIGVLTMTKDSVAVGWISAVFRWLRAYVYPA